MTREEAIARIKDHKSAHKMHEPRAIYISEALDMAIKALEKQPVLGKIRAEIEEHAKINQNLNTDRARALCWCLDVIDKHKAESEERE